MKTRDSIANATARRTRAAFTLVEIALCIAIVAFALVAIIGVLPTGLEVKRENREDTVVNQDLQVWTEVIRSASTNSSVLTNYVEWVEFRNGATFVDRFYATNLTSREILGLICNARYSYTATSTNTFRSVIKCRAISRPLSMEATNIQDMTFSYLLRAEVIPMDTYISNSGADYGTTKALKTNLWDLRLVFEWPVIRDLTNGSTVGSGFRSMRTMVAAGVHQEPGQITNGANIYPVTYSFFTPGTFMPF